MVGLVGQVVSLPQDLHIHRTGPYVKTRVLRVAFKPTIPITTHAPDGAATVTGKCNLEEKIILYQILKGTAFRR